MSPAEAQPSQASPFWRFSLRFYRQPDVAAACIALQEEAGVDVNLLLFLLWHATHEQELLAAEVAALEARVGPWREAAVTPLRAVRRALRSPPTLVPETTAEAFRTKIKGVELEAERLQQEAMYELTRTSPMGHEAGTAHDAARANIASYAAAMGITFPSAVTETLLAALGASLSPVGA